MPFSRAIRSAAARALEIPYSLGDGDKLQRMATDAGITGFELQTWPGQQDFPSLEVLIDAEIRGWLPIMGVDLDPETIETVRAACEERLAGYIDARDGALRMPGSAHVLGGAR